jgi:hypothetical protein
MQTVAQFMNKQPDYSYFKVNEKRADVFIYEFIEEIDSTEMNIAFDEDGNRIETEVPQESHVYSYRVNIFTVDPKEITEEMIKTNPMKYMNYDVIKYTQEELDNQSIIDIDYRVTCLELDMEEQ